MKHRLDILGGKQEAQPGAGCPATEGRHFEAFAHPCLKHLSAISATVAIKTPGTAGQ